MSGIVKRSDKIAFYGIMEGQTLTYHRMSKFTEMSVSKNPKEYSRQYIDKTFEETDVVGYSPSMSYNFDEHADNPVHADIAAIHDNEVIGAAAVRPILVVDFTKDGATAGTFEARLREFAVIPDGEGDSTDAYTYSGNFKVKGDPVVGTATTTDGWETCTFEPEE